MRRLSTAHQRCDLGVKDSDVRTESAVDVNDSCSERTLTVLIRLQLNTMELLDAFAISDRTAAKTCLFQAYSDVLDVFVYSTEISVCSDFGYLT